MPGWVKHSILFSSPFPLLTHSSEKTLKYLLYVSPKRFVFCNSTFHHGCSIWLSTQEKANDCLVCLANGGASDISCNALVKCPTVSLLIDIYFPAPRFAQREQTKEMETGKRRTREGTAGPHIRLNKRTLEKMCCRTRTTI